MADEQLTGTVLKFGSAFGLIIPDAGGGLVFFYAKAVTGLPRILTAGDRVAYGDIVVTPKGPSARMVKKI